MRRFLPLSLLLLGSLFGFRVLGQTPLPAGPLTPGSLGQYCATQTSSDCAVPLSGQRTLSLHGDWQLPETMHLRFASGSALHITGGVLHFGGGLVDAPATEPIFPDGERVRDLAAARPEWFEAAGERAEIPAPATDLASAYEATEPWGTIYLRPRAYLSPFSGCPPTSLRYLSPRTFVGAGRPTPDDPAAPTHLQHGTVLLGGMMGTAPIRLAHLGIDAGPEVSTHLLHGCQLPALFIEQPNLQFVTGDRLQDVSVLTTGARNMHSVMIAGHREAEVRDLWIWTLYGTHGLVMKSDHSLVDGLHCRGAVSDCLIVKSDYATDFLGRADHDRIAHVDIQPLRPGEGVGGIMIESRWDTVTDLDMQDIAETGTQFGIILLGSTFYRPANITIRNWTADATTDICLVSDRSTAVQVSDFRCGLKPAALAGAVLRDSRNTLLQHGSFRCDGTAAECTAGRTDGIQDDATGTSLRALSADGLGGYFLRSTHPSPPLEGVQTLGMGSRLYERYRVPLRERWAGVVAQIKPSLRILYTAVSTRVRLRPRFYGLLVTLFAFIVCWELLHPLRRHVPRKRH